MQDMHAVARSANFQVFHLETASGTAAAAVGQVPRQLQEQQTAPALASSGKLTTAFQVQPITLELNAGAHDVIR